MKPQAPPEISCEGRDRLTQRTATETVRRATWPASAYHCQHCGHWHVGVVHKHVPKNNRHSSKVRRHRQ